MKKNILIVALLSIASIHGQGSLDDQYKDIEPKVIEWRRHFHKNPELSNREFNTAEKIAKHLKSLGLKVKTGIAHTGVVGLLEGSKLGKVIALRADIDALPVTERNNLEYKSVSKTSFLDTETGVMHACGHDAHMSILMGVAEILSKSKHKLKGSVKFIFQPAEEGPPPGEEGGSKLMIKEGVLENPKVDAIFGLHIWTPFRTGTIHYKKGGMMASVERFVINIKGKQTHGGRPWDGVDPILISAKIIDGLQTIVSRESELTKEAAVISIGKITSGTRFNIIPETAELIGTVRTLDPGMKKTIIDRMKDMTKNIAKAYGGEATIEFQNNTAITFNDSNLVDNTIPTLQKVAGIGNVKITRATTGGEDFSYFQEHVPGFYFFLGGTSENTKIIPRHHTPDFKIDESALILGVKALTEITFDFLNN